MDYTQLWIILPFVAIGWGLALWSKRVYFDRTGDPYRAHRLFLGLWTGFSLFGVFLFLYRAL